MSLALSAYHFFAYCQLSRHNLVAERDHVGSHRSIYIAVSSPQMHFSLRLA